MNYLLKTCTDKLLIATHGYKTPDKVIKKLKKFDYLIINPPFDGKAKRSNRF